MRKWLIALTAMAALAMTGLAAATPTQGVYGTGVQRFDVPQAEGSFTLSVSATTLPSGQVTGHHIVIQRYTRPEALKGVGVLRAKPIYVETDGQAACVVSEVTGLIDWPSPPWFQPVMSVARIVDVPGGPDLMGSGNTGSLQDPATLCDYYAGGLFPLTDGNFTIVP